MIEERPETSARVPVLGRAHAADEPLTRAHLVDFFTVAERPDPNSHMIGTELEKFGVVLGGAEGPVPVDYPHHVAAVLAGLERHGWTPSSDRGLAGEVIALERDGASITLEPGGQLELSGKPLPDVHATCAEFTQHHRELHEASEPLGVAWMTAGYHPWATRDDVHWMPKGRYAVMRAYLPTRGARALDMMLRTCTVQANFDFASERQCGERLRLASAVSPVLVAMFASSPYEEGAATGLRSTRSRVWTDVDPDRCGLPPFVFDARFGYGKWIDWALAVPTFFVKRGGIYHPHHVPFEQYMREGFVLPDGERTHATWGDWTNHLSTLFPEVRLKPYIEFRSADAVTSRYVCALPALLKGLLYDDASGAEAWQLVADLDYGERRALWREAFEQGLASPRIRELAGRMLALSRESLDRHAVRDSKGRTEARFLDPLQELVEGGRSPADEVLAELGPTPGRSAEARRALVRAYHFAGPLP